jgi:hypothetical protein
MYEEIELYTKQERHNIYSVMLKYYYEHIDFNFIGMCHLLDTVVENGLIPKLNRVSPLDIEELPEIYQHKPSEFACVALSKHGFWFPKYDWTQRITILQESIEKTL